MTSKCISSKQRSIQGQYQRPHSYSKCLFSCQGIREPHRFPCIIGKNDNKENGQVQKVPVDVLHNQGKRVFTPVFFARLRNCTGWWISPKGFIICTSIVIAGKAHATGCPQNEKCR